MAIRHRGTDPMPDRYSSEMQTLASEESKDGYIILPYIYTTPPLVPLRTRFRSSRNHQFSQLATANLQETQRNADTLYLSPDIGKPSLAFSRKEINLAPRYPHVKLPKIKHKVCPRKTTRSKKDLVYIPGSVKSFPEDLDSFFAKTLAQTASHPYLPRYLQAKSRSSSSSRQMKRNASVHRVPEFLTERTERSNRENINMDYGEVKYSIEEDYIDEDSPSNQFQNDKKVSIVRLFPQVKVKNSPYLQEIKSKFPMINFDDYSIDNRHMGTQTSIVNQIEEDVKSLLVNEMFDEELIQKKEIFLELGQEGQNVILDRFLRDLMNGNFKTKEDAKKFVERELEIKVLLSRNQELARKYKKMRAESSLMHTHFRSKDSDNKQVFIPTMSTPANSRVSKITRFSGSQNCYDTMPDVTPSSESMHNRSKTVDFIRILPEVKMISKVDNVSSESVSEQVSINRRNSFAEGDPIQLVPEMNRDVAIKYIKEQYFEAYQKSRKSIDNISTLPDTESLRKFQQSNRSSNLDRISEDSGRKLNETVYSKYRNTGNNSTDRSTLSKDAKAELRQSRSIASSISEDDRYITPAKSQDTIRGRATNTGLLQDINDPKSEKGIKSPKMSMNNPPLVRSHSTESYNRKLKKSSQSRRSRARSKTKPAAEKDPDEIERERAARFEAIMLKAEDQIRNLKEFIESEESIRSEQEIKRSMEESLEEIPEQNSILSQQSVIESPNAIESDKKSSKQVTKETELSVANEMSEDEYASSKSEESFDIYGYASKSTYQKFVFNFSKTLEKTILMYILVKKQTENKLRLAYIHEQEKARLISQKKKTTARRRHAMFDNKRGMLVHKLETEPNETDEENSVYKFTQDKAEGFLNLITDTVKTKLAAPRKGSKYFTKQKSNQTLLKRSEFLSQMASEHKKRLMEEEDDSGGFGTDSGSEESYESSEEEGPKDIPDALIYSRMRHSMVAYELKYLNMMKSLVSNILGPEADLPSVSPNEIPQDIYKDTDVEKLFIEDEDVSFKLKKMLGKMQKFNGYIFSPNIIADLPQAALYAKKYQNVNEIDFSSYEVDANVYESVSLKKRFLQYSKMMPNYDSLLERQRNLLYNTPIELPRPDDFVKERVKAAQVKSKRDRLYEERGDQPAVIYGLRPIKSFSNLNLRKINIPNKTQPKRFKSKTNEYEEFVISKLRDSAELTICKDISLSNSYKSIQELSTSRLFNTQKDKLNTSRSSSVLPCAVNRGIGILNSVIKTSRI
jgi:hypothetical protein